MPRPSLCHGWHCCCHHTPAVVMSKALLRGLITPTQCVEPALKTRLGLYLACSLLQLLLAGFAAADTRT
jgi:hypothetical protein